MNSIVKKHKERAKKSEDKRAIKALVESNEQMERELTARNAIYEGAVETFTIAPFDGKVSESTAFALLSDVHFEETIHSDTVNGLNSYNLGIARKRLEHFFQVVVRLVNIERMNTPIHNLVLWLGGDMITGNIHEECLEVCSLRPVEASVKVLACLQSGIDFILKSTDLRLTIPCSVGN